MKALDIEKRGNEAMQFLTATDEIVADLKHDADMADAAYEAVLDMLILHSDKTSDGQRKAEARQDPRAKAAKEKSLKANRDFLALTNRRRTESIAVEWCRSLYSNYKQGA